MVPCFANLGKETRDLFEEHFNVGNVKIEVKNKITSDLNCEFTGGSSSEDGKVNSSLEAKYEGLSSYGMKVNAKWTTDNELMTELAITDSLFIDGLKLSFYTKNSMGEAIKKAGTIKASLDGSAYNMVGNMEFDGENPKLNAAGVYKWNDWLVGLQGLMDVKGYKVENQSMMLAYSQSGMSLTASYNLKDVAVNVFKQMSSSMQRGIQLNIAEGKTNLTFGVKHMLDGSSSIKAKINNDGQVGLAYIYQYKPGVKLAVSSMVEAKNLFTGGHKLGLGLSFEG